MRVRICVIPCREYFKMTAMPIGDIPALVSKQTRFSTTDNLEQKRVSRSIK